MVGLFASLQCEDDCEEDERDAQKPEESEHASAGCSVVDPVVGGFSRVGDPAPSSGSLESQVMTDDALHRCSRGDPFFKVGYPKSEFHCSN